MNNFDNAYRAASAISELAEVELNRAVALAILEMGGVINNEINAVPFELVRHDSGLVKDLGYLGDMAYYISAAAVSVMGEEGHLNRRQLDAQISVLFRCASDLHSELNGADRSMWGEDGHRASHWQAAQTANRKLHVLRDEQEEAA